MEDKNPINYSGYFGDRGLEERGINISAGMMKKQTAVLNRLADERSALAGSCGFSDNGKVSPEALIKEAAFRCESASEGLHLLAIQDSSEINYQ